MAYRSSITIRYDGTDITDDVLFESASFEQNTGAMPGGFSFTVKDMDRTKSFTVGKEVTLTLDGSKLYGGIVLQVERLYAFPVVDTSVIAEVDARQWRLVGSDYNIWLDKLVLHNPANYLEAIKVNKNYDGVIIRNHLGDYLDLPSGFDITSEVDNVAMLGLNKMEKFAFPTQGATWRMVMEDMAMRSGATYFIDADKRLHWHPVGKIKHPWGLTDRPGAAGLIGCRDVTATQDGSQMVTDALVWTGNQIYADSEAFEPDGGGLFFYRFPDPPANTRTVEGVEVWTKADEQRAIDAQERWGRWQYSEQNFGEGNSPEKGARRAHYIVNGPSGAIYGIEGGLGQPLWDIQATWFGHDVPGQNHIHAGYLVNLILYGLGTQANPLVQLLPMRFCTVTFPTIPENPVGEQTYVQFTGRFGLSYSDHRRLWSAIKMGKTKSIQNYSSSNAVVSSYTQQNADDPSVSVIGPTHGSFAKLTAIPTTPAMTTYTVTHAYIASTTRVWMNGLLQRPGIEYEEVDPDAGIIEFYEERLPTDEVFIEFRAAGDSS